MAAINHGGTFYRLDKSSQSGDCGEANVMALYLASKQVMPFAFAVKGIPFGKASLKLKRKATASKQDHFRPSERDLNNRFSCNLTERRLL